MNPESMARIEEEYRADHERVIQKIWRAFCIHDESGCELGVHTADVSK